MKVITDIKESNILLQKYIGANLQIWMFSTSLKRMALKLVLPNVREVVYIVGIGCEYIKGNFSFTNANLVITPTANAEITKIFDESNYFELTTSGGFSIAQGIEDEFGSSFDNFIK